MGGVQVSTRSDSRSWNVVDPNVQSIVEAKSAHFDQGRIEYVIWFDNHIYNMQLFNGAFDKGTQNIDQVEVECQLGSF